MNRQCGECSLCCKLLPVRELRKKGGERCEHQRHTGCAIYGKRPMSCAIWACRWLTSDDTADMRRPDRTHYVIDVMPDFLELENNDTGERQKVPVIQVWLDPKYPDAHEDPELRAYIERRAREGYACLVRTSEREAFSIFAPSLADDGEWHVIRHGTIEPQHSKRQIIGTLAEMQAKRSTVQ
jgi:hypothetical protein